MSRLFGWDLPPGVSPRDIDEAAGAERPCAVCGEFADACVCPECPRCGACGDPACYARHGMVRTAAQAAGLARREAEQEEQARADAAAAEAAAREEWP